MPDLVVSAYGKTREVQYTIIFVPPGTRARFEEEPMIKELGGQQAFVWNKAWKACVGTGRMALALQEQYLQMLDKVQDEIGFTWIRGHGLFHDDMGIYRVDTWEGKTREFYNFTYLDRVFDSYLKRKIKPFLELGFMPSALASGPETVFYWKGGITFPKDPQAWVRLVQATLRHCISRWGIDEVLTWPVEVWNEPNLTQFWKGADQEAYFRLYGLSAQAVREVDSRLRVGGPAICGGSPGWLAAFLDFVKAHDLPLDFVSHHAYAGRSPASRSPELLYQDLSPVQVMLDELVNHRQTMADKGFGKLPLYITEFNTSYHPLCPVHDTVLNAAWLARVLSEAGDHADLMSYWTFGDVFEEHDVPRALFHGGFGLLGFNNIPKPTHHLFHFFARLGDEVLYRDHECVLTRRPDGSLALAAWHLDPGGREGGLTAASRQLAIPCGFLPPETGAGWSLVRHTVNGTHGNPRAVWLALGSPRFPHDWQVQAIADAARPRLQVWAKQSEAARLAGDSVPGSGLLKAASASKGDFLHLDLEFEGNQIDLVEIYPAGAPQPGQEYWGARDDLITASMV